jgi:hypothetical protein
MTTWIYKRVRLATCIYTSGRSDTCIHVSEWPRVFITRVRVAAWRGLFTRGHVATCSNVRGRMATCNLGTWPYVSHMSP